MLGQMKQILVQLDDALAEELEPFVPGGAHPDEAYPAPSRPR